MIQILQGDCRDVLRTLPEQSIDACVTDPPYHLTQASRGGRARTNNPGSPAGRHRIGDKGFMGQMWDGGDVAFDPATWAEVFRVLRPGSYLLAFGGTRTYHRLACAIEDAGFEVRDMVHWLYGNGFPKGTDKAKIPEGWRGWNTALKPAVEPVCLARKPMPGTLAENLRAHGTGALNIDGCRVPLDGEVIEATGRGALPTRHDERTPRDAHQVAPREPGLGRWPANVIHDGSEEVTSLFPREAGASAPVRGTEPSASVGRVTGERARVPGAFHADAGIAARFFYCPKADRRDRNDGLQGAPEKPLLWSAGTQNPGSFQSPNTKRAAANHHPTVKPTDLMRYLCRLVTPPGGTVLDPFMGSGSTLKAAELEGFSAIGIELEAEYIDIARRRIASDAPLFAEVAA